MNGVSVELEHEENLTSHSGAWVVEMQKLLADVDISTEWIKRLTKKDNFVPHLVSLGPFHHGKPELLPMEEHKRRAVLHMARRSGKQLGEFIAAIEEVVDKLQGCYLELDQKWRGEEKGRFVEMMVAVGCFQLEMTRASRAQMGEVESDYADNDPIYSDDIFTYLWALFRIDMVLVENQLPLFVLQKLEDVHHGAPTYVVGDVPVDCEASMMISRFSLLEVLIVGCSRPIRMHPMDDDEI